MLPPAFIWPPSLLPTPPSTPQLNPAPCSGSLCRSADPPDECWEFIKFFSLLLRSVRAEVSFSLSSLWSSAAAAAARAARRSAEPRAPAFRLTGTRASLSDAVVMVDLFDLYKVTVPSKLRQSIVLMPCMGGQQAICHRLQGSSKF